ncbi:MAG: DUF885 domain-containing protein [Humibacillus sp.]|nr:DUF885 domain-containing protein [Humibacillus sp.]MDN5779215.1 DUF885 domain-containing protein [Humibacillus sp.]
MNASEVADGYVADLARTDADAAAILGRERPTPLPQLSPDAFDDRSAAARRARASLSRLATPVHEADDPLALVLAERLDAEIDLVECGFTEQLLAPLATPIDAVRSTFDQLPHETDDEWEQVIDALAGVTDAHADYLATLVRSAERGHVVAVRQVTQIAARCRGWVDHDDFYGALSATAPTMLRDRADAAAASASSATLRFADEVERALLPVAPEADAVGRELYTHTARAFLGCDVDLLETYEWGWSELDRIAAEAEVLARQLHPDGFDAAVTLLDADPARLLGSSDEVEHWLTARMTTIADHVDGRHLDLPPEPLRRPECRMASAASGVMYYAAPDPGLTRPGRVWWTVDPAVGARTWREATTLHHEGVPGHHTQIVTAMTTPGLHPWQRHLCHVHGHAEGWAHWAEAWCAEIGLLDDPAERLGMLIGQAWRAARIVIDMGLHLGLPIPPDRSRRGGLAGGGVLAGATAWSYDVAVDFLRAVTGLGPSMARFEVDRYLGCPAQALAFRVGAREFESIRAQARTTAGPAWNERAFLTDLLRLGPMGVGPLRALGRQLGQPRGHPRGPSTPN